MSQANNPNAAVSTERVLSANPREVFAAFEQPDRLAQPAWDFVRDARLHARMALVRAVENGFAMARVAQLGLLGSYDAYGRVLKEAPSARTPDVLLVYDLPLGPTERTFYTRFGDVFSALCVVALVVLGVWAVAFPRSHPIRPSSF